MTYISRTIHETAANQKPLENVYPHIDFLNTSDFLNKVGMLDGTQKILDALWEHLNCCGYLGFSCFCMSDDKLSYKYGDGDRRFTDNNSKECDYEAYYRNYRRDDLLKSQIVQSEKSQGSYIICPVFGPYSGNAIFIIHAPLSSHVMSKEVLTLLEMCLQKTYVFIAKYEANVRSQFYALSRREIDVLASMSIGGNNKQIAEQLDISPHTVNGYIRRILLKMRAKDRVSACIKGLSIPESAMRVREIS